jgi:hypothetical protein
MNWRNRVVRHDEVDPASLLANPQNWRIHPRAQQDALEGVIDEVGFVSPIIVQDGTDVVIDGHMRVALAMRHNVSTIPVDYVDVDDTEMRLILATFDPISAMAATDKALLEELLRDVSTSEPAVMQMLSELAEGQGVVDDKLFDTSPQLGALEYRIVIDCTSEYQQADLLERFESEGLTCRALMS